MEGRAGRIGGAIATIALICAALASVLVFVQVDESSGSNIATTTSTAATEESTVSKSASRSMATEAMISISVKHLPDEATKEAPSSCAIQDCHIGRDDKNVCGSDGKTYYNECLFRNAQCRDADLTKNTQWNGYNCPNTCRKHITCNEIGKFLCGSDGNVYFGYCNLYVAQCVDPSVQEIECPQDLLPKRRAH